MAPRYNALIVTSYGWWPFDPFDEISMLELISFKTDQIKMARSKILITLLTFVACATSLIFDFDDDFFDDFETTDKRSLHGDGKSPSDGETVFVSESTNKLGDGRETITKESVKWLQNPKTGKWSKKRSTRHFVRLQNGTVLEIEDNGSGEAKSDGEMTKVS